MEVKILVIQYYITVTRILMQKYMPRYINLIAVRVEQRGVYKSLAREIHFAASLASTFPITLTNASARLEGMHDGVTYCALSPPGNRRRRVSGRFDDFAE